MLFDEHRKGIKSHVKKVNLNQSYYSDLKSSEPELVLKVASDIKNSSARDVIDYISRNQNKNDEDEFLEIEDELGNVLNREQSRKLAEEWTEEFKKETKHSRKMTHFVLSVDVDKNQSNEQKLKDATRDFLRERFGDEGFRYTFVIHNDTKHLHAHIVVNNNNLDTGKKLRMSKEWHQESRIMAKKHLSEHGIEQRATLKKDRQYFEKNIDAEIEVREREYKAISNFVDARLKTSSRNSEHFQAIKTQFELVSQAREQIKSQSKDGALTQESIELREQIRQLHKDMILHDRLNSDRVMASNIAQSQFRDVMKRAGIDEAMTERARESRAQEQNQAIKTQMFKLNQHAKELVETQFIVKESQAISPELKKEMLQGIKERKKELTDLGVNVKYIEQQYNQKMRSSEDYLDVDRALSRGERTLAKEQAKAEPIDLKAAEKRVIRMLDELSKLPPEKLNKRESEQVQERKQAVLDGYQQLGLNIDRTVDRWQKHRTTQNTLNQIKSDLSDPDTLTPERTKTIEKELLALRGKTDQSALNKKEQFSMRKSVQDLSKKLSDITQSSFFKHETELDKTFYNLKSLDKKIEQGDQVAVNRQRFALAKAHLQIESVILKEPPANKVQADLLAEKLQRNYLALTQRGVDIENQRTKQAVTQTIEKNIRYLQGLDMKRISGVQFDVAQKSITEAKSSLNQSDLNVTTKREVKRTVNESQRNLDASRALVSVRVFEQLKQIERIAEQIKQLSTKEHLTTLSVSGKLHNKREIEKLGKELVNLADGIKKDYPAIANQQERNEIKRMVDSHVKSYGKTQTFKR